MKWNFEASLINNALDYTLTVYIMLDFNYFFFESINKESYVQGEVGLSPFYFLFL